jgi:hypothetical protein
MDHVEAERSHAVERYVLNEMSAAERDGFEEHYFECPLCANDMSDTETLVASGRAAAHEKPVVVPFPSRASWTWMPLAAAAMLVIVAGIMMPRRSQPSLELLQPRMITAGESRAAAAPAIVLRAGESGLLYVDIPPDPPFPKYEILIRNSAGKAVLQHPVSAEQARESLSLLLRALPAGSYVLAIEGVREDGNRTEIATHQVQVR